MTKRDRGRPRRGSTPNFQDPSAAPRTPFSQQVPLCVFQGPPPYQAIPPTTYQRSTPTPQVPPNEAGNQPQEDFNILCRVVESLATMIRERELQSETLFHLHHGTNQCGVDTSNIEKYRRLNPPAFNGGSNSLVAED